MPDAVSLKAASIVALGTTVALGIAVAVSDSAVVGIAVAVRTFTWEPRR